MWSYSTICNLFIIQLNTFKTYHIPISIIITIIVEETQNCGKQMACIECN